MKRLFLLRHAKSSWHDPGVDDHDRPLNPRGMRAAPLVGRYMHEQRYAPDLILVSSARRTLETLSLVRPFIGLTVPTLVEDRLYLAPAHELIARLQELPDEVNAPMVIAHNPGLDDCVNLLFSPYRSDRPKPEGFPTAALAVFEFSMGAWSGAKPDTGRLIDYTAPGLLDDTPA